MAQGTCLGKSKNWDIFMNFGTDRKNPMQKGKWEAINKQEKFGTQYGGAHLWIKVDLLKSVRGL